jgi:hypothetical protein
MLLRVVWCKFTEVSEVLAAFIIRAIALIEAERISEMSVNFYQTTRHNIPEDSHLHTHRREKLKSHHHPRLITRDCTDGLSVPANSFRRLQSLAVSDVPDKKPSLTTCAV